MIHFSHWCYHLSINYLFEIENPWIKKKMLKKKKFFLWREQWFDGIFVQSHYIRMLPVKIPKYSNGNIIDYDIYDCLQGEKLIFQSYYDVITVTSSLFFLVTRVISQIHKSLNPYALRAMP